MHAATAWSESCKAMAGPVIEACTVASGPTALAREIGKRLPGHAFRQVLCRGGWYRLGRVVDAQGERVAPNLEAWAAAQLDDRDGDIAALLEDYAGSGLRATHLSGRTHYLVAPAGKDSGDFLQLEIEDLQETLAHPLFDREIGYACAWYFHMLTTKAVPHWVPAALAADAAAGYRYLPERDLQVVKNWLHKPYGF